MKHDPPAKVDVEMSIIAEAPCDRLLKKLKSNLEEVKARSGKLINFACNQADLENDSSMISLSLPKLMN